MSKGCIVITNSAPLHIQKLICNLREDWLILQKLGGQTVPQSAFFGILAPG